MGNTVFYKNVQAESKSLGWKDIFSEVFKKHGKDELEYAMTSGMSINTATESDMLRKWHKPWVFGRVFLIGLLLTIFVYAVYGISAMLGVMYPVFIILLIVVPPIAIPVSVLIFFWELYIPKNLSIFDVLGMFFFGGILSLVITMIFDFVRPEDTIFAPVSEEPGKFLAAVIVLLCIQKVSKKRIYGLTALLAGAAVGAGFSAFETIQYLFYSYNIAGTSGIISTTLVRTIGSFGDHTLWCALYTAAFGLACEQGKKICAKAWKSGMVWKCFFISVFSHALWNGTGNLWVLGLHYLIKDEETYIRMAGSYWIFVLYAVEVVLQWIVLLKVVKKCLNQVVSIGNYQSGSGIDYKEQIEVFKNYGAQPMPMQPQPQPMQSQPMQPQPMPMQPQPMPIQSQPQPQAVQAPVQNVIPNFKLSCIGGSLQGRKWKIRGNGRLNIGRADDCHIKYETSSLGISRNHCEIYFNGNSWCIHDLNSTNGTFINDNRLMAGAEQPLNSGDRIALANQGELFLFELID